MVNMPEGTPLFSPGGTAGLARVGATGLARHGATVMASRRTGDRVRETGRVIEDFGSRSLCRTVGVNSRPCIDAVLSDFGRAGASEVIS